MKNIGGAWKNVFKKSGKPYLDLTKIVEEASGVSLNGQKVWLMPNDKRPGKKDPDYSAVLVPPRDEQAQPFKPANQNNQFRHQQQRSPPPPPSNDPWGSDDEIPF